jgi:hypothetical protein
MRAGEPHADLDLLRGAEGFASFEKSLGETACISARDSAPSPPARLRPGHIGDHTRRSPTCAGASQVSSASRVAAGVTTR